MKKKCGILGLVVTVLLFVPHSSLAATPLETIRTSVDRVLGVLRDPALGGEGARETKEKKVWAIIDEVFDYQELSRRTLAERWKTFTPDQQQEFTRLFGKVLGGIYMGKIVAYTNEKILFGQVTEFSDHTAEVQSQIVTPTKSIPIHYRMIAKKGEWKVYDVVIEGVSLVQNYRLQFREILAKKSPEEMLQMLRKKAGEG